MKKQIGLMTLSLMLVTPAALAGGAGAPVAAKGCKSIGQIIKSDAQLSTLNTALEAAGLQTVLNGQGSFTVFAPSNAAFAKLPSDKLAQLLNDRDALRETLAYHVVGEKATAAQLRGVKGGTTVQGAEISIMVHGKGLMVNNANVTKADLMACNGVVHIVDTVLMPPVAQAAAPAPATTVVTAPATVISAPVVIPATPVGSVTVTAPASTDTSTTTTTTDTTVATTTDTTTTTDTSATTTVTEGSTLYDVISADDNYSTFRDLLSDAGLTEELSDDTGAYTVFVPSNAAFDALPDGTLAAISSSPEALKQFLSYYIIKSKVTTEQLTSGDLMTLEGTNLNLGSATVGTVTTVANGNLYPIDAVLMPEDFTIPEVKAVVADTTTTAPNVITYLVNDSRFSTFRELLTTAGLADTLTTGEYTIFAPTNDAFAKMDAEQLANLRKDKTKLLAFLNYLILSGKPNAAALIAGPVKTLEGSDLVITQDGSNLKIGSATSADTAVATGNGNVYIIDAVILPASAQ